RERFTVPPDLPGLTILRDAWSIIMGAADVEVILRFSPHVRQRVLETQWHPSQQVEDDPEQPGYLRLTMHVADTMDMLPWIRSWGHDVEVLAPTDLRETLMGQARRMALQYGWHVTLSAAPEQSSTLDDFYFYDD